MYLQEVNLWNFRKYGSDSDFDLTKPHLTIQFNKGLNVLIGENDAGKTAIIDAIKIILDTHSGEWVKLSRDDFYKDSDRLRIECNFNDLSDSEAMHFTEWLGMKGEGEDAKPFLKIMLDAYKNDNERLHYDIRAGVDDEGSYLPGEAREYLKTTYLKPLRDAKYELIPRRNSRLSQILAGHENFNSTDINHPLENVTKCFNCLFQKYFKKDHTNCNDSTCKYQDILGETNVDAGEDIRKELNNMVTVFLGDNKKQADFTVIGKDLRNILEQFKLSLNDENLGLGSHNLLFIAAELLNMQRKNWTGLRLALIEELEAHLHPQAQMRVIEYLYSLTNSNDAKRPQFILTTHSPNIASKVKLENLIVCHGMSAYPMSNDHTQLDHGDYVFLEKFLDVTKANLFFAKGVILVEGWSEEILLPAIAKNLGISLTEKGVSIINVGSTAFLRFSKIFLRQEGLSKMDIPVAIVTDVDVREYEKIPQLDDNENVIKDNKGNITYQFAKRSPIIIEEENTGCTNKLNVDYNSGKVKAFIAPHWTLEYSLSKSSSLKAGFNKVLQNVHPKIAKGKGNLEQDLAAKLINKSLDKTGIAYKLANELDNENSTITINRDDQAIKYIIEAIDHACGN